MSDPKAPTKLKYRGALYTLQERQAGGLGSTRQSRVFDIIEKDYGNHSRKLSYEDGTFVLHLRLGWEFAPEVEASFTIPLSTDDAALMFSGLKLDKGVLSESFAAAMDAGAVPSDVKALLSSTPETRLEKQLTASAKDKRTGVMLTWKIKGFRDRII